MSMAMFRFLFDCDGRPGIALINADTQAEANQQMRGVAAAGVKFKALPAHVDILPEYVPAIDLSPLDLDFTGIGIGPYAYEIEHIKKKLLSCTDPIQRADLLADIAFLEAQL